MIKGYKSIKTLIAKVYRDLDLKDEDRWVSMIEWAAEALQLIGAYSQFVPKTKDIAISNYRGSLPCDYYKMIQVSLNGGPVLYASGSFDNTDGCADCLLKTDPINDPTLPQKTSFRAVYTINDSYIFTNFTNTQLCLSYLAIPVDDEGFPLMPEDVTYDEAVYRYIITKLYFPDFLAGRMPAAMYDKLENDWNYKCMAARGSATMPNLDQLESIKNMWVRLIPDINRHSAMFNEMNQRESIKIGR